MLIKPLIIKFEDWTDFKSRVRIALKKRKPSIASKNTLVFASVTDYQKFMTEQKIAILAAIIHKRPTSIYQLAQFVERVCVALEAMGFIKFLEKTKNSKQSKAPRLSFNYSRIEIHMPQI